MFTFIARRLVALVPVLLGVTFLTFAIIQVTPGDPVALTLGGKATPEQMEEVRHELGLDEPFITQYVKYVARAIKGDLGRSIHGRTPVIQEITSRFPSTFQLAVLATCFAIIVGIATGVIAAANHGKIYDQLTMFIALSGISIPSFWLAIVLILIFGVRLKWISVIGGEGFKDLILPTFCLGVGPAATLARLSRSCMLEVFREDYVRTARSKGFTERVVIFRHVLRNSLIPVITVIGLQFGFMLGGTVFIESVFSRPGLGRYAVQAINRRDYPQIQGSVLFMAVVFVMVNLAVDILYGYLDPRIRLAGK